MTDLEVMQRAKMYMDKLAQNPYRVFISDLSCEHSFYTSCRVKRLFHSLADVFLINRALRCLWNVQVVVSIRRADHAV